MIYINLETFSFIMLPEFSEKADRWEVQVDLDSVRYKLNVSYNSYSKQWVLSFYTIDDVLILGGLSLVVGTFLLEKYQVAIPTLPRGELWLLDTVGDNATAELARDNFSTRFRLCYGTW